ncbi:MAG: GDP-L-fucose synthase [Patescibacteria group bacterium]
MHTPVDLKAPIFIAGHRGMVGSSIWHELEQRGAGQLIGATHAELELRDTNAVEKFFAEHKPTYVVLAAAKVGGIQANINAPADFLYDNLAIQNSIYAAALKHGVKKILFLGTSCIYPRECPQPMKEEYLLTGPLEPTNEGYALAKIAGIKLAEYMYKQHGLQSVCPMPPNLYGPNDNFDPKNSHVLAALVRKFVTAVDAKADVETMWGSGTARREFMHVDDVARIAVDLFNEHETPEIINIGPGIDSSIKELAELVAKLTGYTGPLHWDTTKPDGMPRKCLDVSRMRKLGLGPTITLEDGIKEMITYFRKKQLDELART